MPAEQVTAKGERSQRLPFQGEDRRGKGFTGIRENRCLIGRKCRRHDLALVHGLAKILPSPKIILSAVIDLAELPSILP